ncbi:MAG: hypothetical protein AAGC70_08295 [Pseudomonadota bacterium]
MSISLIGALIRAAWRQRYVIVLPLCILLPAVYFWALSQPREYESSALLMLQEAPELAGSPAGYSYYQELATKVKGLEALLKSQFLLSKVLISEGMAETSEAELAASSAVLRERIVVQRVGAGFVRVAVIGSDQSELQNLLSNLLATLFETLLNPADAAFDAKSFVQQERARAVAALQRELQKLSLTSPNATETRLNDLRTTLTRIAMEISESSRELSEVQAELSRQVTAIEGDSASRTYAELLAARKEDLAKLETQNGAEAAIAPLRTRVQRLVALEPLQSKIDALRQKIESLRTRTALLTSQRTKTAAVIDERNRLGVRLRSAQQRQERAVAGLNSSARASALIILKAPAQIRVVDPPSLPSKPLTSLRTLAFGGAAGALAFVFSLALLLELLDTSLRSATQLASVTQVPVIARLNRQKSSSSPRRDDGTPTQSSAKTVINRQPEAERRSA